MSLTIVIPMAGAGSRFKEKGFTKPKPFIDVQGKPMIGRVLENLFVPGARFVLIAQNEHLVEEKDLVDQIKEEYSVDFVGIDGMTEGAACTVLKAHRLIDRGSPLLVANCDQIIDVAPADYISDMHERGLDGSILTFKSSHPKWSYARLDQEGLITEVKEKEVISEHATVGLYAFQKGRFYMDAALDMILNQDRVKGEYYVCPVYNYCVKQGLKMGIYPISIEQMHGIGTPEDLELYLKGR